MIFTLIMYRENGATYSCHCCGPTDEWDSEFKFFQTTSPDELTTEIVKFYDDFDDPDSLIIMVDGEKIYCNDFGLVKYEDTFLSDTRGIHDQLVERVEDILKEASSRHKENQETKRLQRLAAEEEDAKRKEIESIEYRRKEFEKLRKEFGE